MIGVEIFSGPGGMSLGAQRAGVDVRIAVEFDHHAARTYAVNHKRTTVVNDDVRNVKEFDLRRGKEQLVLFGGPPCQGYSKSNRSSRTLENPLNKLYKEFDRIGKMLRPDWIVVENVPGFMHMAEGAFFDDLVKRLRKQGYTVNFGVLDAANFGVPQRRERIFIVASLHGVAVDLDLVKKQKPLTVGEALCDLPALENGAWWDRLPYRNAVQSSYASGLRRNRQYAINNYVSRNSTQVLERYPHIPQGGNWQSIPPQLMQNYKDHTRCHHRIYHRLHAGRPAVVIGNYRKNMLVHPTEDRGLSVREAARLQSFPDGFVFTGPLIGQQQQVGDAVPPSLAQSVFNAIDQTH
ncbi:MAG: DNA cytosine methyltransferase [Flavobacteriales bacterium]|nr:DNA cytosine methyltransferase [Flavobacteriales bacterium]